MTKKQKQEAEIAAIEAELRLMACGALGGANVDPPDCGDLFAIFDGVGFSRYLSAVEQYWNVNEREQCKYMMRFRSLDVWAKSYTAAAEYLHRYGARAGGRWAKG